MTDGTVDLNFSSSSIVLSTGQSVTFRIAMGDDRGSNSFGGGLQAVQVLGSAAAIPEPSSFGVFAGLGALLLVARRRRN